MCAKHCAKYLKFQKKKKKANEVSFRKLGQEKALMGTPN